MASVKQFFRLAQDQEDQDRPISSCGVALDDGSFDAATESGSWPPTPGNGIELDLPLSLASQLGVRAGRIHLVLYKLSHK